MSGSRRDRLDAWLFLPPELEREGPVLLALRRWVVPRYSRPADEPTVPQIA